MYHFFSPSAAVLERILVVRKEIMEEISVAGRREYSSSIVFDFVRRSNLGE